MTIFKKEQWITVKEASEILDVSRSRIYVLMDQRRIKTKIRRFYKRYLVSADDVEQYRIERESV